MSANVYLARGVGIGAGIGTAIGAATGASVRVLNESTDSEHLVNTVRASTDSIEASWLALYYAPEYRLLQR